MGFERTRLALAALVWAGAGAVPAAWGPSPRAWTAAAVLALVGAALAARWGARPAAPAGPLPEAPPPAEDAQRAAQGVALLEHLPVAAWSLASGRLTPLTHRAHRLQAPGGVRDVGELQQRLRAATQAGPVVLDTERGSERWQLQRQALSLNGEAHTLLVLVPLESELEAESLQAWQQLVQVLTHEIMNSLTPVQSLSQGALALLDESPNAAAPAELRLALDAIARRAQSLAAFVGNYRRVSQWPAPHLAPVDLAALFARLQHTVGPAWAARGGEATFDLGSPTLRLLADEGQLEQALLALLRNAEQATSGQAAPRLWVQARQGRGGRLQLSVRDNGPGVPPGLERQIFLPFFSAREPGPGGEAGQGIGLTVVRQLVHGMGGRVRHVRPLEGGAAFVLSF